MESAKITSNRCCLGGFQSKTNTHNNNLNSFDCGSTIDQPETGIVCDCGLFMCYQYIQKIKIMVMDNLVLSLTVPTTQIKCSKPW